RALIGGERGRVALALSARHGQAAYDGTLIIGDDVALEGKTSLKTASLPALADWLDRPPSGEARAREVCGALARGAGATSLPDLPAVLGDSSLSGNLELDWNRSRPYLTGRLRASELDLGRLLLRPAPRAAAEQPPAAPQVARQGDAPVASDAPPPVAAEKSQ